MQFKNSGVETQSFNRDDSIGKNREAVTAGFHHLTPVNEHPGATVQHILKWKQKEILSSYLFYIDL